MDYQKLADELCTALQDKGYERPEVIVRVISHSTHSSIALEYSLNGNFQSKWFWAHEADPAAAARSWLENLPTAESIRRDDAREQLARAVDMARECGIEFTIEYKHGSQIPCL